MCFECSDLEPRYEVSLKVSLLHGANNKRGNTSLNNTNTTSGKVLCLKPQQAWAKSGEIPAAKKRERNPRG